MIKYIIEDEREEEKQKPRKKTRVKEEPKIAAEAKKKEDNDYANPFDFKNDPIVGEDFKAQQAAIHNQALYGESKVEEEINALMSGKQTWRS